MYKLHDYLNYSRNFYISIIFILPMLFLYEFLCFLHYSNLDYEIRNSADVLIKSIINYMLSIPSISISLFLIIIFFIIIYYNYNALIDMGVKLSYFFLMLIESFFLSLFFFPQHKQKA